jgi:hypothetical protein
MGGRQGRRPSFLKKRSKKLLVSEARRGASPALKRKSFLVLFFKKEHFFLISLLH